MKYITILMLISTFASFTQADPFTSRATIATTVASLLIWNPMKLDGLGFDQSVDDEFQRIRMLWLWDMDAPLKTIGPLELTGHYEFSMGQINPKVANIIVGVAPVLEWHLFKAPYLPYIETGLSVNWISNTQQLDHQFSTHFQFGEQLGVSVDVNNFQLGVRYQHHSNGSIKFPNNGYNFYGFVVKYRY